MCIRDRIASEQGIHPNQLKRWKVVALEGLPSLFSKDGKTAEVVATEHERQIHELYAEIGRLTTQLTWLQKKSGVNTAKSLASGSRGTRNFGTVAQEAS